jgi:hypothetical protein
VNFEFLYELNFTVLYAGIIILIAGAAELGRHTGLRRRKADPESADLGTLAGAALGLLALLLAFSFSIALSRYDGRRDLVLEEANAIGSAANFALMLPVSAQEPILALLRDYAVLRIKLGVPSDTSTPERDIARSLDLQARLWRQAGAITRADPQSLSAYRFVSSLNEMNNIHERRITALRSHVPVAVVFVLMGVALVAMVFAGYNVGVTGARRRLPNLLMSAIVVALIVLVLDLDRPNYGLIQVPVQALADAARGIPP